jgi:hypothetical protein
MELWPQEVKMPYPNPQTGGGKEPRIKPAFVLLMPGGIAVTTMDTHTIQFLFGVFLRRAGTIKKPLHGEIHGIQRICLLKSAALPAACEAHCCPALGSHAAVSVGEQCGFCCY